MAFYAVKFGRKPGIYDKLEDALKQTVGFSCSYLKKFKNLELAEKFLKDPPLNRKRSEFYADKIYYNSGIYEKSKDAEKQMKNFSSGHFSKLKNIDDAQDYANSAKITHGNKVTFTVKIDRKPSNYFTKEEEQKTGFCDSSVKKIKTIESPQHFLNDRFHGHNSTDMTGVSSGFEDVTLNMKYTHPKLFKKKCNNEQALGCVRQATKHKMTGQDISYLATKKIRVDESGSLEPTLRNPGESIAVFASGEIVNDNKEKRAGIGVYWGPNHPLNVSKRVIGSETTSEAKKYAVVHAIYQAIQSNVKKITLYCDWSDIQSFAQCKAIGLKMDSDLKIEMKEFLTKLELVQKDIDIKFVFIKAENYTKNNLPINEKPCYNYYEGYSGGTCFKQQGMWEANKLAQFGCNLDLMPENISEFQSIYNRKKSLSSTQNPVKKIHVNTLNSKFVKTSKNHVQSPATTNAVLPEKSKRQIYYAVHRGHVPGVYSSWEDCRKQVINFKNPIYKHFCSEDDANQFVLNGKVVKSIQIKLRKPKIEVKSEQDGKQQLVQNSGLCKNAEIVPKTEINDREMFVPTTEINRNTPVGLLIPKKEVSNDNRKQLIMTGEVQTNRQFGLLVPKKEVSNDNRKQLIMTGEVLNRQFELLVPKTEPINRKDNTKRILSNYICDNTQVEAVLPKKEVNRNEGVANECSQVELIAPKTEIMDNEFIDVFLCGRSMKKGIQRAGIGIYWSPQSTLNTSLRLLGQQINNRADIWAAIYAFRQAKKLNYKNICAYTDSQFIVKDVITFFEKYKQKNWRIGEGLPAIYQEDFKLLDKAMTGLRIKWCNVKERNNRLGFMEAERLAIIGCNKLAVESQGANM